MNPMLVSPPSTPIRQLRRSGALGLEDREAEQEQARAQAQAKAEAKQALCREHMSMWLEDPVQQRFDKEDHERDVEWLRKNFD